MNETFIHERLTLDGKIYEQSVLSKVWSDNLIHFSQLFDQEGSERGLQLRLQQLLLLTASWKNHSLPLLLASASRDQRPCCLPGPLPRDAFIFQSTLKNIEILFRQGGANDALKTRRHCELQINLAVLLGTNV